MLKSMNVPLLMVVGSSQNKTVIKGEVPRQTKQWLSLSSYCKKNNERVRECWGLWSNLRHIFDSGWICWKPTLKKIVAWMLHTKQGLNCKKKSWATSQIHQALVSMENIKFPNCTKLICWIAMAIQLRLAKLHSNKLHAQVWNNVLWKVDIKVKMLNHCVAVG